jgi:hypothetical protein
MYKVLEKGAKASLKMPFKFCRNEKCKLFGVDQTSEEFEKEGPKQESDDNIVVEEEQKQKQNGSESISIDDEQMENTFVSLKQALLDCRYDDRFVDEL